MRSARTSTSPGAAPETREESRKCSGPNIGRQARSTRLRSSRTLRGTGSVRGCSRASGEMRHWGRAEVRATAQEVVDERRQVLGPLRAGAGIAIGRRKAVMKVLAEAAVADERLQIACAQPTRTSARRAVEERRHHPARTRSSFAWRDAGIVPASSRTRSALCHLEVPGTRSAR